MAGLGENGIWRVRERGTKNVIAHVRLEYSDEGLSVYYQIGGEGPWEEDYDALSMLFGDMGAVEQIS